MPSIAETARQLARISNLQVCQAAPLKRYTRFGVGGPADIYAETDRVEAFVQALNVARESGWAVVVIGGGPNLIVSDDGFRGIVLRFTAANIDVHHSHVIADAGAELQEVVDFTIARGLRGMETMAGIPGSLGAAVYGNAGAYGRSISQIIERVRFFDGSGVRTIGAAECDFHYRESVFKRHKEWIVFSAELVLEPADASDLRRRADEIVAVRSQKFPPTMKCAGSIFKNLLFADLPRAVAERVPPQVIKEGKVPAAFFLEQAGAKGLACGDIRVADYHANLVYNAGEGTASQIRALIRDLKARVRERFGFELEEEVQYVGFAEAD